MKIEIDLVLDSFSEEQLKDLFKNGVLTAAGYIRELDKRIKKQREVRDAIKQIMENGFKPR